jgi:hypothetical protein
VHKKYTARVVVNESMICIISKALVPYMCWYYNDDEKSDANEDPIDEEGDPGRASS